MKPNLKIKEFAAEITQLLSKKRVPKNRYREVTLNEQRDGTFILRYHIGGYCRSGRALKDNTYPKQFRLQKRPGTGEWVEKMPCQCYGSPKQLRIENLPKNWKDNLTIRKASSMYIRSRV